MKLTITGSPKEIKKVLNVILGSVNHLDGKKQTTDSTFEPEDSDTSR